MSLMYNYARSEDKPYAHNVRILIQARIEHFSSTKLVKLVSAAQQRKTTTQRQKGNATARRKAAQNFIVCGFGFQVQVIRKRKRQLD